MGSIENSKGQYIFYVRNFCKLAMILWFRPLTYWFPPRITKANSLHNHGRKEVEYVYRKDIVRINMLHFIESIQNATKEFTLRFCPICVRHMVIISFTYIFRTNIFRVCECLRNVSCVWVMYTIIWTKIHTKNYFFSPTNKSGIC